MESLKPLIIVLGLISLPVAIHCMKHWRIVRRKHTFTIDLWRKVQASPPHISEPIKMKVKVTSDAKTTVGIHNSRAATTESKARASLGEDADASLRHKAYGWQDFRRQSEMAQSGTPICFHLEAGTGSALEVVRDLA